MVTITNTWPMGWGAAATDTQSQWFTYGTFEVSGPVLDGFGRTEKEARKDFSRAKAVPPVHLPGDPEDRVEPLWAVAVVPWSSPRPAATWITPRIGRPRERTCSRSRRRRRTWERGDDEGPTMVERASAVSRPDSKSSEHATVCQGPSASHMLDSEE